MVTKPGLPVPVGEPAINPGPRQLIARTVEAEAGPALSDRGLRITISVPDGAELARQTANPRLGIVGGISILGTTGIVKPYSQGALSREHLRGAEGRGQQRCESGGAGNR